MKFKKLTNGRALYVEENTIWIAKGMTFYSIDKDGHKISKKIHVGSIFKRAISSFRLFRLLLREGLHHLIPLGDNNFFVVAKRKIYILDKEGNVLFETKDFTGNKPAHQGTCVTPSGDIFFGEYTVNLDHSKEIRLLRKRKDDDAFYTIKTFEKSVRHIHFVKYDKFEDCIWLGTGDEDSECILMNSYDNGENWNIVGSGSQLWRAIGLCFTKNYIFWGTDAGSVSDKNHLVRLDRKTNMIEKLSELEGPCHGCGTTKYESIFISTGVEGGENEKDRFARLKSFSNHEVHELYKAEKDIYPLIIQYGVIRLPGGLDSSDKLIFTTYALKNQGECIYIED